MTQVSTPIMKQPYELGAIPADRQLNRGWNLEVTDTDGNATVIENVGKASLSNTRMGLELEYGLHPAGYDVWKFHEPNGGGAIAVPYAVIKDQLYVGLVDQNRPTAGGVISELPRGFSEPKEDHLTTVQREMGEETGLKAVMDRFTMVGKEKNPNTAFFDTSAEGEGLRFYALQVNPETELEAAEDADGIYYRFNQVLLEEAREAGDKGAERILTSRFVTLTKAVQESPDLMTGAGVGMLVAHLVGRSVMGVIGTSVQK